MANYAIIVLQAASLIGILASFLIFNKKINVTQYLGVIFGLINFTLILLVEGWFQGQERPFVRNDLLFLSGFFGGWPNALAAAAITWLGERLFDQHDAPQAILIDIAIISCCALLLRAAFGRVSIEKITHRQIILMLLIKSVVVIAAPFALYLIGQMPHTVVLRIMEMRMVVAASLSVVIVYAVIFLIRHSLAKDRLIYIDSITRLPNRRALRNDIAASHARSLYRKNEPSQVLLLIEIDNLADLIQEYDHDWADGFVRQLGGELETQMQLPPLSVYRPTVYCFSDRAFAVILRGLVSHAIQGTGIVHALHGRLVAVGQAERSLRTCLSIGVVDIEFNETFSASWFLRALNSMDKTQHTPVHYFEPTITGQVQFDNRLRVQIDHWIRNGIAPLWLQPKVFLPDRSCVGAETLLRAQDKFTPEQPYIAPPHVLAVAARHHMLADLEWTIIKTAVRYLQKLAQPHGDMKLSVNISPALLAEAGFGRKVCTLLNNDGVAGQKLVIEVIETSSLALSETVQENFTVLRQAGVSLSLDDFGSGYASLSLLSRLPFDELKLDYGMISGLDNPRTHAAIMTAIDGAERYTARVVAEGIETEEQRQKLVRMGITCGQGFLFARAMPFDRFLKFAAQHPVQNAPPPAPGAAPHDAALERETVMDYS